MWEGLLPIGSVVTIKGADQKVMISGLCMLAGEDQQLYDYAALLHPYGYIDRDKVFAFNHEDISEIFSVGYMDNEHFAVYDKVNSILKQVREGKLSLEDLKKARPPKPEVLPR